MSGRVERIRYADGQIDDIAEAIVGQEPRAADYLAQAPIIALAAAERYGSHITFGELDRLCAKLATGPRLKDVMKGLGTPAVMRGLDAGSIKVRDRHVVAELARIDPSSLAQSIPSDSQRVWLDGCAKWLALAPTKKADRATFSIKWIARELGANLSRFEQVDSIIDWCRRANGNVDPKWTFEAALKHVETWHARLRDRRRIEAMTRDAERRAKFDTVICKAPLPDEADLNGYTFIALRTARSLHIEGVAMHHCVASYAGSVARGKSAVVSIRRNGVHIATLELNERGQPTQIKAHCNGVVSGECRVAADLYALTYWRPDEAA